MTNDEAIEFLKGMKSMYLAEGKYYEAVDVAIAALKSNWTVEKRKERAEWLKKNLMFYDGIKKKADNETIDCAFELEEPTLEEKLRTKWMSTISDPAQDIIGWDVTKELFKGLSEVSRDYFKSHPEKLEGIK